MAVVLEEAGPAVSAAQARAGSCRSCGAPILWATTEKGKAIPLDAEPADNGNVEFTGNLDIVRVLGGVDAGVVSTPRYTPHHATCPEGAQWRRR